MTEKKPAEPNAEQLLKLIDLQLAEARKRREARAAERANFRIFAILLILLGTAAAFGVLLYLAEEMRPVTPSENVAVEAR